jgi:hypothetical protein
MPRVLSAFALLALVLVGCQRIQEPIPTLTQDQWRRVNENILTEAPDVAHPIDAVFGEKFRLIGWEMEPESIEAGDEFTIVFYWEVLQTTTDRWHIFVHMDSGMRQNLDHEAMANAYPTVYWEQGQIIRDEVSATLNERTQDGDVRLYMGFYRGDDRLPVSRAGEGRLEEDGRLYIGQFSASSDPYEIRRFTGEFTADGQLDEVAWRRAEQTTDWGQANSGEEMPLESWAKVMWDSEYLYVAMHAEDPDIFATMVGRDEELWNEEVLEFYWDGARSGRDYLEFQVNPLGTVFDANFPQHTNRDWPVSAQWNLEGLEIAVAVDGTLDNREDEDRSWTAEMRIPLTSLPSMPSIPPENGDRVRLNFYRYDRSGSDNATTYYGWSPVVSGSFHQPERFGEAVFRGHARSGRRPTVDRAAMRAEPTEASGSVVPTPAPAEGSR